MVTGRARADRRVEVADLAAASRNGLQSPPAEVGSVGVVRRELQ
ncbi:hypothetical protein FDG2_2514 [Candidatus Protofrankia californiensis]|uniref:Uncharacterized protein n=1 Tax=Candidatus Protofrankia californiensis TaxID=1839754 RepID=A0A1C3NXW0_9ACTN|nr:hypothetical protein FDG2_2514 [Candidatus Protofrankia californiensis]